MIPRALREAAAQGAKLFLVMAVLSALFIAVALVVSPIHLAAPGSAPPAQSHEFPGAKYTGLQLLLHVVTGTAAGAVSLDPAVALVGGAVGPLIDLDHVGFFAGLPVDARVGHSFLMVALIVLLDWRLHFWRRGTRNLFLFVSLEFSVHLTVAPPGFPLLGPLSATIYYFPRVIPAVLAAILAVGFLFDSTSLKRRAPPNEGRAS